MVNVCAEGSNSSTKAAVPFVATEVAEATVPDVAAAPRYCAKLCPLSYTTLLPEIETIGTDVRSRFEHPTRQLSERLRFETVMRSPTESAGADDSVNSKRLPLVPVLFVTDHERVGSGTSAPHTPPTRMVEADMPMPIGCHLPLHATPPKVAGFVML